MPPYDSADGGSLARLALASSLATNRAKAGGPKVQSGDRAGCQAARTARNMPLPGAPPGCPTSPPDHGATLRIRHFGGRGRSLYDGYRDRGQTADRDESEWRNLSLQLAFALLMASRV